MAAHNNALESLGVFASGVAAAVASGADPATVAQHATAYVVLRAAFVVIYIFLSTNELGGALRSATWWTSAYCAFRLFSLAAESKH